MTVATAERQENRVPEHLIDAARNVDITALAERYTTLHRESGREFAGPCPKCGGSDRFHVSAAGWWFCRQCHTERGDSVSLLQWLTPGLGFREAVAQLTGQGVAAPATTRRQPVQHRRAETQPRQWREVAERIAGEAYTRLWSPEGDAGREYLEQRGIESSTALQFGLGFRPDAPLPGTAGKQRAAALVLPWRSGGMYGACYAIRYRFLETQVYEDAEGRQRAERLVAETGSQFAGKLYGSQGLPSWVMRPTAEPGAERLRWLLLCEGEINALSCWQVAHFSDLDVVSIGSESAKLSESVIGLFQRYGRVLVWADRAEVAQRLMATMPGAYGVRSPGGKDANDLLRSGHLGGFLAAVRADAATSTVQLERLLWALWDSAGILEGIDASSAAVLNSLAAKLGKDAPLAEPEPGRWVQAGMVAP